MEEPRWPSFVAFSPHTVAAYIASDFQVDFEIGKFREHSNALVGISQESADSHGHYALVPGDKQWSIQLNSCHR